MTGVLIKRRNLDTDTHRKNTYEHEYGYRQIKEWGLKETPLLQVSERKNLTTSLIFYFLASRSLRQYISVV